MSFLETSAQEFEFAIKEMQSFQGQLYWQPDLRCDFSHHDLLVVEKWDVLSLMKLALKTSGQVAVLARDPVELPEGLVDYVWSSQLARPNGIQRIAENSQTKAVAFGTNPALFMDRDGVINIDFGYVGKPEQVQLVEGIGQLIARARKNNFKAVVITNQSGIGRGLYSEADLHQVMNRIDHLLLPLHTKLDDYAFAGFHPQGKSPESMLNRQLRKPRPGMIHQMARKHGLAVESSFFIGDRAKDLMAATLAGVGKIYLFESPRAEIEWEEFQIWEKALKSELPSNWPWPKTYRIKAFSEIGSF